VRLTAPEGFEFYHINYECGALVEELAWTDSQGRPQDPLTWSPLDSSCRVDEMNTRILNLKLVIDRTRTIRSIENGNRQYKLTVSIYNPALYTPNFKYRWSLASFSTALARAEDALDESEEEGFMINHSLRDFYYTNEDASGEPVRNGLTAVTGLRFYMNFDHNLNTNDVI
jgi:hypothetical protein